MAGSKAKKPDVAPPVVWLELDLGDTELVVREHSDGAFTLDVDDTRVVLNADQMRDIVLPLVTLGRAKGWIAEADGS